MRRHGKVAAIYRGLVGAVAKVRAGTLRAAETSDRPATLGHSRGDALDAQRAHDRAVAAYNAVIRTDSRCFAGFGGRAIL